MMIKEPPNQNHHHHHHHLLRHRPPALHLSESGTTTYDSFLAALCGHLPSSNDVVSSSDDEPDLPLDVFSDEFRMYEFKVRRCTRGGSHDWTECPYAHPGEKARRRDPLRYNYCGTSCTDFRKGSCKKGDSCEFAHGVFECWLHPSRYRTQLCKDGPHCQRRVCFFAHSPDQLRVGSKLAYPDSPRSNPVNDLIDSLTELQLNKVKSIPSSWKLQIGSPVFGSPRGPVARRGFFSLPTTPTQSVNPARVRYLDRWETGLDEGVIQRVESGKELRARMFEKLSEENPLNGSDPVQSSGSGPDVGWVSDLIN